MEKQTQRNSSKSKAHKTHKTQKTLVDVQYSLPKEDEELLKLFTAIDTACSIVRLGANQQMTLQRIQSTVEKLSGSKITIRSLCQIQTIWPNLLTIRPTVASGSDISEDLFALTTDSCINGLPDVEITFNSRRGSTQEKILLRTRQFRAKLVERIKKLHDRFLKDLFIEERSFQEQNQWHPKFSLDQVPHITPTIHLSLLAHIENENLTVELSSFKDPKVDAHSETQEIQSIEETKCAFSSQTSTAFCQAKSKVELPECTDWIKTVFQRLCDKPSYINQLWHIEVIDPRPAKTCPLLNQIHPILLNCLISRGFNQLYAHQAQAIDCILQNKSVMVCTSTSSGKSLCYNIPIIHTLLSDQDAVAVCLYPTKALAQDQLRALYEFIDESIATTGCIKPAIVDGDTQAQDRLVAQGSANIILTNPDLLHCTIIPSHGQWQRILSRLRFLVLDECHIYRGAFGIHVCCIIRRLLRMCHLYGANPIIIGCSATINNPKEHFLNLVGSIRSPTLSMADSLSLGTVPISVEKGLSDSTFHEHKDNQTNSSSGDIQVISEDGSPCGQKFFVLWNPPIKKDVIEHREKNRVQLQFDPYILQQGLQPNDIDGRSWTQRSDKLEAISLLHGEEVNEGIRRSRQKQTKTNKRPRLEKSYKDDKCHDTQEHSSTSTSHTEMEDNIPIQDDRCSAIVETASLLADLCRFGIKSLVFCKVRRLVELVTQYCHDILRASGNMSLISRVMGYRSGYMATERRDIERKLFSGQLLGVVTTNALELGIDIGSLDVTLHLGFPGSISSLWQQAGRSGRRGRDSLSIFVAFNSPLDQYFLRHPRELFSRQCEAAVVDPSNPNILKRHLVCAACEQPLMRRDICYFGSRMHPILDKISREYGEEPKQGVRPYLIHREGQWYCDARIERPAMLVPIRSIEENQFSVIDSTTGECIEEVDETRVQYILHDGAIYLRQGQKYIVQSLDFEEKCVTIKPIRVNYYTMKRDHTDVFVMKRLIGSNSLEIQCQEECEKKESWPSNIDQRDQSRIFGYHPGVRLSDLVNEEIKQAQKEGRLRVEGGPLIPRHPKKKKVHKESIFVNGIANLSDINDYEEFQTQNTDSDLKSRNINQDVEKSAVAKYFGIVKVQNSVYGYRKLWNKTHKVFDQVDLNYPPTMFETLAFWVEIAPSIKSKVENEGLLYKGGSHAIGHCMASLLPLFIRCERYDVGTEHISPYEERNRSLRLILYDVHSGGVGIALKGYEVAEKLLRKVLQVIEECPCQSNTGCPSCIQDPNCTEQNHVLDKMAAISILRNLFQS